MHAAQRAVIAPALAPARGGWRVDLAGEAAGIFAYHDCTGHHRLAAFAARRLVAMLFVSAAPVAALRRWAIDRLRDGVRLAGGGPSSAPVSTSASTRSSPLSRPARRRASKGSAHS
jgi:hypothetical protein